MDLYLNPDILIDDMSRQYLVLLTLCLTALTCRRCPPDIKIGTLTPSPGAQEFFAYEGDERITFIDSLGESYTFTSPDGIRVATQKYDVSVYCESTSWFAADAREAFELEAQLITFVGEELTFTQELRLIPFSPNEGLQPVDTDWYADTSFLEVLFAGHNTGPGVQFQAGARGQAGQTFPPEDQLFFFEFQPEVTLLERTFNNVYSADSSIWVNADQGIVAFRTDGKLLVLDKIE